MHFAEAFSDAAKRSSEDLRNVLADQLADVVLRAAAALLLAKRRDLPLDRKVCWLLDGWASAPSPVRKYILKALGECPSSQGIVFLKEQLNDPDLRLAALDGLAAVGDECILAVCRQLIRSGTECECRSALRSLMALGTNNSKALVGDALKSAPSESCRQRAALLLALNGIANGEALLETKLSGLQPLRVPSTETELEQRIAVDLDYLLTANALAHINNGNGRR